MQSNTEKIAAFFPLGVFLLPGEDFPLRIFEPRYLQLIQEAEQDGITFVIPFSKEGELTDLGCEVKLQQVVAESEQGKKVITVEAISVVSIETYTPHMNGKLYAGGKVKVLPPSGIISNTKLAETVISYSEYYDKEFARSFKDRELHYYDVVRALNLSSEEKFRFVRLESDAHRNSYLLKQLNYYMHIHRQEQLLNNDFHLN